MEVLNGGGLGGQAIYSLLGGNFVVLIEMARVDKPYMRKMRLLQM
ncbi:hypothetical protein [Inconstantimicrobium mannanitabidum]|nr:hypothetical protein [Clostridium sp. TW13]